MNPNTGETFHLGTYDGAMAALDVLERGGELVEVSPEEVEHLQALDQETREAELKVRARIDVSDLRSAFRELEERDRRRQAMRGRRP